MKKGLKVLFLIAALSMSMVTTAFAGAWQSIGSGWRYQKDNGAYARGEWVQDDGLWYYFDDNGMMQTGWVQSSGGWYNLGSDGAMRTTNLYNIGANTPQWLRQAHYLLRLESLVESLESIQIKADVIMGQIEEKDFLAAKKALQELKPPLIKFMAVEAPDNLAPAHEKMKIACQAMIDYLDDLGQVCDIYASGREATEEEKASFNAKISELSEKYMTNLSEAFSMINEALD